jgi:hypothetical protein
MVQGKVTYDFKSGDFSGRLWGGFLVQHQQELTGPDIPANGRPRPRFGQRQYHVGGCDPVLPIFPRSSEIPSGWPPGETRLKFTKARDAASRHGDGR